MKKTIISALVVIATMLATMALAGPKVWVYLSDGNRVSFEAANFDSLSLVEPGIITISETQKILPKEGGRFNLDISSNMPWKATVNDKTALVLSTDKGQAGDTRISVLAANNLEGSSYTGIITFTLDDGTYKQCFVTVKGFYDDISISLPSAAKVNVGSEINITATVVGTSESIDWSVVSGGDYIQLVKNGNMCEITGIAEGTAEIKASLYSKEAYCTITIDKNGIPDIPEPDAQHAKIAIQIPAGTECYGITFHGSISHDAWELADWEFEAVEGAENWYVAEVDINPEPDSQGAVCYGKPCLYREDGTMSDNWSTQWTSGSVVKGDDVAAIGMGGDINKVGFLKSGVVYIKVDSWQVVPCAPATPVTFSIKVPVCDVVETVAFIGSMTDWADEAMEWNASTNYWEVEYDVQGGGQFKFRDIDQGWDNQLQYFNEETGEWSGFSNFVLTDEDIAAGAWTMDLSNGDMYRWSNCEAKICNPEGPATVTLTPGFPENVNVIGVAMLGAFNDWNLEAAVEMTPDNDSYAGTFEATECEEFKFVYKLEGMEAYDWDHVSTNPNLTLPEDNVAEFVFDASDWYGLPDAE